MRVVSGRLAVVLIAASLVAAGTANAEVLSSKSRSKLFSSQTRVLDTRAAQQYNSSIRLQPPKVITPTKWGTTGDDGVSPKYRGRYKGVYAGIARDAARRHGVPEDLFLRLVQQESKDQRNGIPGIKVNYYNQRKQLKVEEVTVQVNVNVMIIVKVIV